MVVQTRKLFAVVVLDERKALHERLSAFGSRHGTATPIMKKGRPPTYASKRLSLSISASSRHKLTLAPTADHFSWPRPFRICSKLYIPLCKMY
ncbi:MAG TPA: hypothetical protein VGO47_02205 [Chlamydiales bacterium]|nr:hypothetical protein [Chlamydiales bacterium]